MKNEYIRRGMLAGNSEIPIDLIPSLPGTTLFNSNLECENLLGEEQSAQMIIKTELGTDVVTFSQIDASHIKSRIAVPTIQINGNSVPKYKAEIIQSVLVIQSPYTKTLEIVPVVNDTVSNAAKAFGFFISPDPRAVSRVGEISSAPGIGQTSQHNLATYITRFEDNLGKGVTSGLGHINSCMLCSAGANGSQQGQQPVWRHNTEYLDRKNLRELLMASQTGTI